MLTRVYGIHPWEMEGYTPNELRQIDRELRAMADAARRAG